MIDLMTNPPNETNTSKEIVAKYNSEYNDILVSLKKRSIITHEMLVSMKNIKC